MDYPILQYLYRLRSPVLNSFMREISNFGGILLIYFCVFVVAFLFIKKNWKEALRFSYVFGIGALLNFVLKNLFQRVRPQFYPLIVEKDYSFPSGHAMNSIIFYFSLVILLFTFIKNRIIRIVLIIISSLLTILIGISRIYLGVHYPSDVLGGYVVGIIWLFCAVLIEKMFFFSKRRKRI